MNNAKMWLVVKPTVGIPLFLSAVAIGSFAVHVAVLSNTTWVSDFLSGREIGSGDKMAAAQDVAPAVSPAAFATTTSAAMTQEAGAQVVLVVMPDGTTAKAILQTPVALADLQYR
ncbi:MAG: light-harvesting protein [Pikeienuella sp.]|uniref:light-harvesting protein n=1 Tax=Pikeienuella sp. TaxID=2831957 RepID=UPI00391B0E32